MNSTNTSDNDSSNSSGIIDIEILPDKEFRTKKYIETIKLLPLNSGLILEHLIIKWNDKYTINMEEHDRHRFNRIPI